MGHISWNFTLKDKEVAYPNLETWVDKFSVHCGLKIVCETKIRESGFRNNYLSHPLLSEKIYFCNYDNELDIDRNAHDYAYLGFIILEVVLQETIDLGGGILSLPLLPKEQSLEINQNTNMIDIFEYFFIGKNDLTWAKYPYEIAKNIEGFRA